MAQSNIPPVSDGLPSERELSYGHKGKRKDATMRPVGTQEVGGKERKKFPSQTLQQLI